MKKLLLTTLLRFGLEKTMMNKFRPKRIGLLVALGLFAFLGGLFFLIAIHNVLRLHYGLWRTNFIFSFLFLAIAAGLAIYLQIQKKEPRPFFSPDTLQHWQQMAQPFIASAQQIEDKTRFLLFHHRGKIIFSVMLLGILLGRQQSKKWHNDDDSAH